MKVRVGTPVAGIIVFEGYFVSTQIDSQSMAGPTLFVNVYDSVESDDPVGYAIYAPGHWSNVELVEDASDDVKVALKKKREEAKNADRGIGHYR